MNFVKNPAYKSLNNSQVKKIKIIEKEKITILTIIRNWF